MGLGGDTGLEARSYSVENSPKDRTCKIVSRRVDAH